MWKCLLAFLSKEKAAFDLASYWVFLQLSEKKFERISLKLTYNQVVLVVVQIRPKICCFFSKCSVYYFTSFAIRSADQFSNEQQILELIRGSWIEKTFWRLDINPIRFDWCFWEKKRQKRLSKWHLRKCLNKSRMSTKLR